jgi:hypothetical protein
VDLVAQRTGSIRCLDCDLEVAVSFATQVSISRYCGTPSRDALMKLVADAERDFYIQELES